MTEEEAAVKLCALLNEIQAAGIQVAVSGCSDRGVLDVGDYVSVIEPLFEDASWETEGGR